MYTYNKRNSNQPKGKKGAITFEPKLEISEECVELDWNVLHQEDQDASWSHNNWSIDGEEEASHCLLES